MRGRRGINARAAAVDIGRMQRTNDKAGAIYGGDGFIADVDTLANSKFIIRCINSSTDLPAALAEIRRLQGEIENMKSPEGVGYSGNMVVTECRVCGGQSKMTKERFDAIWEKNQ